MQTAHYNLVQAADTDYDFIYGLARTTMRSYVAQLWGWDEPFQSKQFCERFVLSEWNIVSVDGRRAGCVNVRYNESEIFLANLYVHPDYQRRGIGSSIIRELIEEGRRTNRPVRLHVLTSNPAAYRLYLRLGFRVVESSTEKRLMSTD